MHALLTSVASVVKGLCAPLRFRALICARTSSSACSAVRSHFVSGDWDVIAFCVCGAHSSSAHFAHSPAHTRSHTHSHTHLLTHSHPPTRTHTHTHTHTHTCLNAHDRTCVCALQNDPRNFLRSLFARTSRRRMQLIATLTRHSWCDAPLALPVANLGLGHGQPRFSHGQP